MARPKRVAPGGMVFHVLNRGVGRMRIFDDDGDYFAFERIMEETLETRPMRICAYCLMPNHWHMVLWPEKDGELAAFMQRLTVTHVDRWQRHRDQVGFGHVYQARFKSFPVETDEYFYQVVRYVERNPVKADLVERAEDWRWSSAAAHCRACDNGDVAESPAECDWLVDRTAGMTSSWSEHLAWRDDTELSRLMRQGESTARSMGDADFVKEIASLVMSPSALGR